MSEREISVEVFSDVVCPWCYIGTERLERVRSTAGEGTKLRLEMQPFLLQPGVPPEGLDLKEMLAKKYGANPESMFANVERVARESGLPLDFSKVKRMYSTLGAHVLIKHAAAKGTQWELSRALFRAYFLEEKNISDADVLADIGEKHGYTRDEARALVTDNAELSQVRLEAQEASQAGIRGVPFFVFDQKVAVSGAQPEEVLRTAIAKVSAAL